MYINFYNIVQFTTKNGDAVPAPKSEPVSSEEDNWKPQPSPKSERSCTVQCVSAMCGCDKTYVQLWDVEKRRQK